MTFSTSRFMAIALLAGFAAAGWSPSAIAQSEPTASTEVENSIEPADASVGNATAETIRLEPRQINFTTEGLPGLGLLAEQINQGVGSDADGFLPDGMVVRGSNSSLQVGGEL